MHIVAFRHVPFEGLGLIAESLEAHGIDVVYADLYLPAAPLPDVASAAGLIFMGGPMSANEGLPYLAQEARFIRQAVEAGQPVLGVCLGAQLIARALGAAVRRNPVKEIGWFDIHLTEAGGADPLFHGLARSENVFHWHGETFDLPPGAAHLAYSNACTNQAFRVGTTVYGLQFHLEVTPAIIADWCVQDANCGDVRELDRAIDPRHNAARLALLSEKVFGAWCEFLVSRYRTA
jgi:GMP synthase-like glutamine amidotransferase